MAQRSGMQFMRCVAALGGMAAVSLLSAAPDGVPRAVAEQQVEQLELIRQVQVPASGSNLVLDVRRMAGAVRGVRLGSRRGDIVITNVRLTYDDGTVFNEDREITLGAGQRTRAIDPSLRDRFLTSIEIDYRPAGEAQTADASLDIFAHQTRAGRERSRVRDEGTLRAERLAAAILKAQRSETRVQAFEVPVGTPLPVDRNDAAGREAPQSERVIVPPIGEPLRVPGDETAASASRRAPLPLPDRKPERIALAAPAETNRAPSLPIPDRRPDAAGNRTLDATPDARDEESARGEEAIRDALHARGESESDGEVAANRPPLLPARRGDILDAVAPQQPGEILLGAQRIGFGLERDVIRLPERVGLLRRIRLRVLENGITLTALTIVDANGNHAPMAFEVRLEVGQRSRWVDLDTPMFVSEVGIAYVSSPDFAGRARLELIGEYADGWLGEDGQGRHHNDGWVMLGAETAAFDAPEQDRVVIGADKGRFKSLKIGVRERSVTIGSLRIVFDDGTVQTLLLERTIAAGASFGPITLEGGARTVGEVQSVHRSQFFDRAADGKGAGIVEVWGRY